MNDKQVFATILGAGLFGLVGSLLIVPIQLMLRANDGGDDGWGFLWVLLILISAMVGAIVTARWTRGRFSDFKN